VIALAMPEFARLDLTRAIADVHEPVAAATG
jgi:hypothetical protein